MTPLMVNGKLLWPDAQFAYRGDPRFSYCMHLPQELYEKREGARLLVAVHGTGRSCMAYRDALAAFADSNRYVILAPLFPVGVLGDDNADGYKYVAEGDVRYDRVLLGMVAQLESVLDHRFGRFSLFGFSGGGHFAHRFFYLQPRALRSVSVGAPGAMTLLDDTRDFWIGTRDFEARYGQPIDLDALRQVRDAAAGRRRRRRGVCVSSRDGAALGGHGFAGPQPSGAERDATAQLGGTWHPCRADRYSRHRPRGSQDDSLGRALSAPAVTMVHVSRLGPGRSLE